MKKLFFMLALIVGGMSLSSCDKDDSYEDAYEKGIAFLEENAKREGVVVTSSGLQYEVLKEGDGKTPTASSSVRCNYTGRFIDGKVFDSGSSITFPLYGVISGWKEGLQLMKEGSKYRFYIPYQLAYGAQGAGNVIPPYSALIFDVELLEVLD